MSLTPCQINPIDVNFHLQNSLEIFDKNSADKIQSKKYKGIKEVPSLMPIRVKIIRWESSKRSENLDQKYIMFFDWESANTWELKTSQSSIPCIQQNQA